VEGWSCAEPVVKLVYPIIAAIFAPSPVNSELAEVAGEETTPEETVFETETEEKEESNVMPGGMISVIGERRELTIDVYQLIVGLVVIVGIGSLSVSLRVIRELIIQKRFYSVK